MLEEKVIQMFEGIDLSVRKLLKIIQYQIQYTLIRIEQWIMLLNINVEQKHLNHLSFPGTLPNGIV